MLTPVQAHILELIHKNPHSHRRNTAMIGSRLSNARCRLIIRNLRRRGLLAIDGKGLSPSGKQLLKKDQKMRKGLIGTQVFWMRYALSKGLEKVTFLEYGPHYVRIRRTKENAPRREGELCVKWSELELTEEAAVVRALRWAQKKEKALKNKLERIKTSLSEFSTKLDSLY
jgi:hypothetical protein